MKRFLKLWVKIIRMYNVGKDTTLFLNVKFQIKAKIHVSY